MPEQEADSSESCTCRGTSSRQPGDRRWDCFGKRNRRSRRVRILTAMAYKTQCSGLALAALQRSRLRETASTSLVWLCRGAQVLTYDVGRLKALVLMASTALIGKAY